MRNGNDQPPSLRYAARTIGVSMPTLYRLISEGKLRSYHVGRAHRVSEDAVRDCVAALEQETATRNLAAS
jgi:excisionase family DNA binding protein